MSAVPVYSTLVPLIGVLAVTAIKDAYDDIVRIGLQYSCWDGVATSLSLSLSPPPLSLSLTLTLTLTHVAQQKRHVSDWQINHRVAHVLNPVFMR